MPRRKGNQSGSYRINGSGKWVVRYGELRCDGKAIRTKYTDRTLRLATPKELEDFRQSRKVPRTVERDGGALVAAANELRVAPSQLASFAKTAEAYRETMEGRLSRGTQRTYNTILDAHLIPLFGEYQLNEPERCVFGNHAGGPRHTGNVAHDTLKPAARRAGLGAIRLHDFRHSWVSRAHDEGVSVETRAAIAGHSAAVDRATYTHVGDQREAMEKMAKKGRVN